jgi:hypothetical protein
MYVCMCVCMYVCVCVCVCVYGVSLHFFIQTGIFRVFEVFATQKTRCVVWSYTALYAVLQGESFSRIFAQKYCTGTKRRTKHWFDTQIRIQGHFFAYFACELVSKATKWASKVVNL